MSIKGIIFDIQRFTLHDGPGIRTTVFLKGCPLKCLWCHNPESINPKPELFFFPERCVRCGSCVEVCPNQAVSITEGIRVFSSQNCTLCGKCTLTCSKRALSLAGYEISSDEVIHILKKDLPFYKKSNGGITLSGGEPLLQQKFVLDILKQAKALGIHTCIDTTAYRKWEHIQEVVPYIDLFLVDLKSMDTSNHRELTGVGNGIILENIKQLVENDARIIFRVPVIPGVNDDIANFTLMVSFLKSLHSTIEGIELLPFNVMARSKYQRFGKPYLYTNLKTQTPEKMNEIAKIFAEADLPVKITTGFGA